MSSALQRCAGGLGQNGVARDGAGLHMNLCSASHCLQDWRSTLLQRAGIISGPNAILPLPCCVVRHF
eukprot:3825341-Amphidinium_carterae.1